MDESLYRYSLLLALPLMLFFGCYMLFARVPDREVYSNYLRSRRLMGVALLILAGNYSVHLISGIRSIDVDATIIFNMATYFLCYWLFCSGMIAGEGLVGILLAILAVFNVSSLLNLSGILNLPEWAANTGSLVVFALIILCLLKFSVWKKQPKEMQARETKQ